MKSIFTAGVSWKVAQGKTKFTLLIFVRSEEDDPLGPTPLDIYLLYYLLRGLSSCFLLLGRVIIKEWDFKPNAKAQVLAPHTYKYSVFIGSNLNLPLKLIFLSTSNNLLLMICYQNIVNTIFHKNFWFNIQWTEILERLNFIFNELKLLSSV